MLRFVVIIIWHDWSFILEHPPEPNCYWQRLTGRLLLWMSGSGSDSRQDRTRKTHWKCACTRNILGTEKTERDVALPLAWVRSWTHQRGWPGHKYGQFVILFPELTLAKRLLEINLVPRFIWFTALGRRLTRALTTSRTIISARKVYTRKRKLPGEVFRSTGISLACSCIKPGKIVILQKICPRTIISHRNDEFWEKQFDKTVVGLGLIYSFTLVLRIWDSSIVLLPNTQTSDHRPTGNAGITILRTYQLIGLL